MIKHILVVDDEPHICDVISFVLEKAQMRVSLAHDGKQALQTFQHDQADLIILDINMPEMDGLACCQAIRQFSDVPILFLSSRDDEIDRILGLEIGGDDYVTKPFSPRELVARVKVILKRTQATPDLHSTPHHKNQWYYGPLHVDKKAHQVFWQNQAITLTATEFAIIAYFIQHPKTVLSREVIMQQAYPYQAYVSDRTIDSHIRHIRDKFRQVACSQIIETVHGVGYKLVEMG
ncbi:MAG TPA: response regulator transcription factor [Thiothrix sp.]|nr:response regulator transcription factor [Thiothrix sp.]